MFSPPRTLKLEGQEFILNTNINSVVLEIIQPFATAGRQLGWKPEHGQAGFGINQSILKFVISRKTKLIIRLLSESKNYWMDYDELNFFIRHYPCKYTISGKELYVIPFNLFVAFNSGEHQSC